VVRWIALQLNQMFAHRFAKCSAHHQPQIVPVQLAAQFANLALERFALLGGNL
jgi:hypothetical protein